MPAPGPRSAYLSPAHQAFRQHVRDFLARLVVPQAAAWEADRRLPRSIWKPLATAGLLGLHYPTSAGGSGKDIFHSVVLLEELGRIGCCGFRVAVAVHAYMASSYLAAFGSDRLKQLYLAPAIAGEKIAALAITEPQAGSDLAGLECSATRRDDHFVVSGRKQFVANGRTADFIVLAVRTGSPSARVARGATGLTLLVMDQPSTGLRSIPLPTIGWHSADVAELVLDQVVIPAENVVGGVNRGFVQIMHGMQLERLVAGVLAIGDAQGCLELTWRHLKDRRAFGGTLSDLQALRHRMADLVTEVEAARQLAYHAAWLYEQGDFAVAECSMLKLKATELARRVAQECLQFHGAHGFLEDSLMSRIFRDAHAATIAGGSSEVMRDIIVQAALNESP